MSKRLPTEEFYQAQFNQQKKKDAVPSNKERTRGAEKLTCVLYLKLLTWSLGSVDAVKNVFNNL